MFQAKPVVVSLLVLALSTLACGAPTTQVTNTVGAEPTTSTGTSSPKEAPDKPQLQVAAEDDGPLSCEIIPDLAEQFLGGHTVFASIDDDLESRVISVYIDQLDPTKVLLTQAEFDAASDDVKTAVKGMLVGQCDAMLKLEAKRVLWHTGMLEYARKRLADPAFAPDPATEIQIDPDQRSRPLDATQQGVLRDKVLELQLANSVRSGIELKEAQGKLVRRYERTLKIVKDRTRNDLFGDFMRVYAAGLDPHSSYFSAEDLEDFRISMQLSLEGIGALLRNEDGYTIVQEIVPGGAADRHGQLKVKDRIIAVSQGADGEPQPVVDLDLRDVIKLIRGKKGTDVKLTVLRQGDRSQTIEILITRDKIDLEEQHAKLRWEKREVKGKKLNLAVIELPSFYGGGDNPDLALQDVKKLLQDARKGKADGVLLDLSRNGGGLLRAAVDISGLFIARGPVVAIQGRVSPYSELSDEDPEVVYDGPLVVLISRASASASEILAGALQDYERARIVGDDQTFGKGTVQSIINLPRGFGAFKVTVATFFLPGGESTQSRGVSADIVVPSPLNTEDFGESSRPFALPGEKINAFDSPQANPAKRAYKPITQDAIRKLAKRSKDRIAKDEALQEVIADLAERDAKKGMLKLADILEDKDADPENAEADDTAEDDTSKELTPQAEEALNILADMVALR